MLVWVGMERLEMQAESSKRRLVGFLSIPNASMEEFVEIREKLKEIVLPFHLVIINREWKLLTKRELKQILEKLLEE